MYARTVAVLNHGATAGRFIRPRDSVPTRLPQEPSRDAGAEEGYNSARIPFGVCVFLSDRIIIIVRTRTGVVRCIIVARLFIPRAGSKSYGR